MPHALPPPSTFRHVHFEGQHSGEKVILLLRRHAFVFAVTVAYFLALAVLPVLLHFLLPESFIVLLRGTVWEGVLMLFLSAYTLFLWLFFAFAWVDYILDLWIVTDERVVNIEQAGLFNRVISEQPLTRIQDVTSEVKGVFPTFLSYGHVFCQTAAERERFVFEQVPNPDLVKKVVLQAHREALAREGRAPDDSSP